MESPPEEPPEDGWHAVATLPDPRQARELAALLRDAGMPVRVETVDGSNRIPGVTPDYDPRSFVVLVPEDEVPVAIGVAERVLPWFGTAVEGELSEADVLAALGEPHEAEFAESLEAERARRARRERVTGGAILVFVLALVVVIATAVVQILLG